MVNSGRRKVADGMGFSMVFTRYSVYLYHLPLAGHDFVSTDQFYNLMDA